jgi:hypothetical protein
MTDLCLVMDWDGVMDMLWLDSVGCGASIVGSETDGPDVIGPWVSGRSAVQTVGVPGGLVGAGLGGQESMAGWGTRPRTGEQVTSCSV